MIEIEGQVRGFEPDSAGGIATGALVASFNGGPPFLMGSVVGDRGRPERETRLLWTAPHDGQLAFAVSQDEGRRLSGAYAVRLEPLGRRGDPRQRRLARPWISFVPGSKTAAFLEVAYGDRAGFGLDRKTLQVILDTERGERFVLSHHFRSDSTRAVLQALPREVELPPGVHRVTATIGDALGNVSPAAEIFLDRP